MADTKFTQPVMGRRTFVGGALATGALAALAGCGGGGGCGFDLIWILILH